MTTAYPVPGRCWWCGSPADSREHKFKRSDLVRAFGKGPYHGDETLVRLGGRGRREVHGPNSDAFKFSPSLCQRCNNERSQPFDRAYEHFIGHVDDESRNVLRARRVNLAEVYGPTWHSDAMDLARYLVKHIGCRLAEVTATTPTGIDRSLPEFLDGGPYPRSLELELYIDTGLVAMDRLLRAGAAATGKPDYGHVSIGPLWVDQTPEGTFESPEGSLRYRWLTFYWRVTPSSNAPNPLAQSDVALKRSSELFDRRAQIAFWVGAARYRIRAVFRR
jgi:hypothetical protein